jgi:3D (Asp-Asp-Asp) domain-containing protein
MNKSRNHVPAKHRLSIGILAIVVLATFLFEGCVYSSRFHPPSYQPIVKIMEVTGYCNCGKCCSWKYPWYSPFGLIGSPVISAGANKGKQKNVGQTAWGTHAAYGTVAADASLPFGTILFIPGYGYGRVEDRGGAIKGDKLDLWFPTHDMAKQWGRKKLTVKIWKR